MKIATYNVNGIGTRLPQLLAWLEREAPDVACLQELKADDARFPAQSLRDAGYGAVWQGQRSWNGVAILARGAPPVEVTRGLPGDERDDQSRYLVAAVGGVVIACLYAPNGNPQPGPKFEYKLRWFERLIDAVEPMASLETPVVLAGDYNVVPTDFDIYDPKSWRRDALLQPQSREAYARLLAQGWTDALRVQYPDEQVFTFWDYFRNHWARNAGLRIDHLLLNRAAADRLRAAGVDRWVRGEAHASDHAPTWVELEDRAPSRTPARARAPRKSGAGVRKRATSARRAPRPKARK
jgi:exodeoxyribonuclease-3